MASARVARPWLSSLSRATPAVRPQFLAASKKVQSRTFLSNPLSDAPEVLTAHRTVPYPAAAVYEVISDVGSYASFLPFCRSSNVTKHSKPHPKTSQKYPEEATLVIGFDNNISESFTSRVHCVPNETVEAISGPAVETSLSAEALEHHSPRPAAESDPTRKGDVLTHLRTTWELRSFPYKPGPLKSHQNPVEETGNVPAQEQTEVILGIEYKFANPFYGAMSKAAAPKVAEYMVEAFEKRIQDVLHRPAAGVKTGVIKH
ncbi:Polyketide cyclase / dehydrase and lipid transport-like protein [Elsinoe fawcettii]|nr:Polyketide cyclase / dehydrase and lipid transport-like protein [Elsinoe fawcettii]